MSAALEAGEAADALPGVAPIAARGPVEVTALARGGHVPERRRGVARHAGTRPVTARTRDLTTHLARRNHGLVDRLVTQIGDLETAERSPSVLTQLSRLKHTATRTRRHAESMLVLTGALPDRRPGPGRRRPTCCVPRWPGSRTTGGSTPTSNRRRCAARVVADLAPPGGRARRERRPLLPARHPRRRHRSARHPRLPHRHRRSRIRHDGCSLDAANGRVRTRRRAPRRCEADRPGRRRAPRRPARDHRELAAGDGGGIARHGVDPERLLVPMSDLPAPRRPVSALRRRRGLPAGPRLRWRRPAPPAAETGPLVCGNRSPPAVAAPEFVRPGVPRRVRGAQLPDLGPTGRTARTRAGRRTRPRAAARDAGRMSAARTYSIPPLPQQLPGSASQPVDRTGPAQAPPAPASDGDD